jgi:predicted ABC-type ATPase
MPHLIIIAGPNGAGKSTAAPALLNDALHMNNFVNADVIAQGLCAYQPEKAAIQAGRIMLDHIHTLADKMVDFAFETTLASRSFATWIPSLKKQGYQFHLVFLWLKTVDLAIFRVKERIKTGGHSVPVETIKRRYIVGLKNFFNLYTPLADSWQFYDNSDAPFLIASKTSKNDTIINDMKLWQHLLEISNGKR